MGTWISSYPVSISVWLTGCPHDGTRYILLHNNTDGNDRIQLRSPFINSNTLKAVVTKGGVSATAEETTELTWQARPGVQRQHVLMVCTSTQVRLWIDGVEQTADTHSLAWPSVDSLSIGNDFNASKQGTFVGVDELSIWSADMSSYVDDLYNGGLGVRYSRLSGAGVPTDDLVNYYNFQEDGTDQHGTADLTETGGWSSYSPVMNVHSSYANIIYQVNDLTGNGNHVYQPTTDNQMELTYSTLTALELNTRSDGANDYYASVGNWAGGLIEQPDDIFCVRRHYDIGNVGQQDHFDGNTGTDAVRQKHSITNGGARYAWAGNIQATDFGVCNRQMNMILLNFNGSSSNSWVNGVPKQVNLNYGTQDLQGFTVGARSVGGGGGNVAHAAYAYFFVYREPLTDQQRNEIGQEISTIVGQTWTDIS
jgi:hypothetical protein